MGRTVGTPNRNNNKVPKGTLTPGEKRILLDFSKDTFTLEVKHSKERNMLEEAGLIQRHPGGPFGSRCSYYRTEEGLAEWTKLIKEQAGA